MSYPPQPPGGWQDPSWSSPQPGNPYDPAAQPAGGQPVSGQPVTGQPVTGAQPGAPYGGYGYPGYGPPMVGPGQPTNGLAIAALVCSLAGLVTCISAPVGAVLGHVARRQIRERGEGGDGMALAAIIVGWILTVLFVLGCGAYAALFVWAVNQDPSTVGSTVDLFR